MRPFERLEAKRPRLPRVKLLLVRKRKREKTPKKKGESKWYWKLHAHPLGFTAMPSGIVVPWWACCVFNSTASPFIKGIFLFPKFPLGGPT
jgi:hypothetical protein